MTNAVVVTGASAGIGAAIRDRLLADGWIVVGIDRNPALDPTLAGRGYIETIGDVSSTTDVQAAVDAAESGGRLAAWVNNAGVIENTALHTATDADIERTLGVNLVGTIKGSRAALASFLTNHVAGSIVNVSSIHGRGGFPGNPIYDTTKGGIEALTRYLAVEYGALGIRANCVAPGAIRTELIAGVIDGSPDPIAAELAFSQLHPLGRIGEPSEVAQVVSFLLSNGASLISGATIPVDAGAAARVFGFPPHPDVPASL